VSPGARHRALLTLLEGLRARSERRLQGATQPADPVGRPIDVRPLCASPVEPPGAVVAGVEPVRRTSRLDLRSLVPLVVARDGDEIGRPPDGGLPHVVVPAAVLALAHARITGGAAG